ncbi:chloride channel protein [Candidatus Sumerlaeota bacterium]|nr:chloride channel protein [Candidatus Sumerlaeota bacterium]
MSPTLQMAEIPTQSFVVDGRVVMITAWSILLGGIAALIAELLKHLIGLVTNLAYYGRISAEFVSPMHNTLGWWAIIVPVIGGLIVGVMARYGSSAIRGHGIPEAMEQVLTNESRIPLRITWLKPLSAAVAIGTGGPFGAEGPIIATGGALGSTIGQCLRINADERKTLLAAGAAAGMSATFGSPVSAVLIAIELLLFEFRPRSIIPVALAASTAAALRILFEGSGPTFPMPALDTQSGPALMLYVLIGALVGLASVAVTKLVYAIEDLFDKLPMHWMWWPAIGAVAVGVCGLIAPRSLGVGYDLITDMLNAKLALSVILVIGFVKLISWSIALGSGTSGGTLAPLFIIGGGFGSLLGGAISHLFPAAAIDLRIAALVGMAAMFAGASRALLTSVVFAFEITLQPLSLLPLLGGCTASYLVSFLLMRQSIMTEKIARRGINVPNEYHADPLVQITVSQAATREVVSFAADSTVGEARTSLESRLGHFQHQGFPVTEASGVLVGVITRRTLLESQVTQETKLRDLIERTPVAIYEDCTLREAADHMVNHNLGRLPVLTRTSPAGLVGMLTRSDILSAYRQRIREMERTDPVILSSFKAFRKEKIAETN